MEDLHALLRRQLAKQLPLAAEGSQGGDGAVPAFDRDFADFLKAVSDAYEGFDDDLRMLERSLELSSSELLQANSELRAIFQAFPDLLFRLDPQGKIIECKGGSSTASFMPLGSLLGKHIQSVPVEEVAARFRAAIKEVTEKNESVAIEYGLPNNGEDRFFEARLIPLPDGNIIAVIRNITERKVAENALRFAQFALDRTAEPVFWVRPDARLFYANDAACKLLRYNRDDLLELSFTDFDASLARRDWHKLWHSLQRHQHLIIESEHRASDQSAFPVEVLMSHVEFGGEEYACVFARDISERRRAAEQLRECGERLAKQQTALVALARNSVLFEGDLLRAMREVTEAAGRTLNVARASAWLYDCDRQRVVCVDLYEREEDSHSNGFALETGLYPAYFHALEHNRIIDAEDARSDARTRQLRESHLEPLGISSRLDVPIVLGGVTLGVACFEHCGSQRRWEADEQGFAGSIADVISLAVEAAQRRTTETTLRIRTSAMNAASDQILILDSGGMIEYVNPAFERETGLTLPEIEGQLPDFLATSHSGSASAMGAWEALKSGDTWHGEQSARNKEGLPVFQDVTVTPIRNELGAVERFVAIKRDITEKKTYERQLNHLAHHDPLTGLPNRLLFSDRLTDCLGRARKHGRMVAVLFLDLDRFKVINDSLGHSAGDMLIQAAARRLENCLGEAATIARMGGDEFTVVLSAVSSPSDASAAARRAVRALSAPFEILGHKVFVTTSVGVSVFPRDGDDVESLVRNADSAMYRAKEVGRNNYQFYAKAMNAEAAERMQLECALRGAIQRSEFVLHYQPKVDLRTGSIVGAEALLRWRHPELGTVAPAQFIGLAEETGLIVPIGEWVIRAACTQSMLWRQTGARPIPVSVNVSPRQFRQEGLVQAVTSALDSTGLPPDCLDIELTENVLMENLESAIDVLETLKAKGLRLSLDDFGTGYSSLTYLKRLPVDAVKIDKSFIQDLTTNEDDMAITRAVIAMAQALRLTVIAEGVETYEQLQHLRLLGCSQMQGYFVSRPVPADEFVEVLEHEAFVGGPPDARAA